MIIDYRAYLTVALLSYVVGAIGIPLRGYRLFGIGMGLCGLTLLTAIIDWIWS